MKFFVKATYILAINIFFLFLVIIAIEGVFRFAGIPYKDGYTPNENSFARFDPELGWSYQPNKSAIHQTGNITREVHFDENGIRIPYAGFKFDTIKPSVLFIGGSFTMGHGMSYEESYVGKFGNYEEVPYQVVNLGVQGYGSDQALLTLKKFISEFNTKVVVYTFIEDHIRRNGNYDRRALVPTARFLGTKPKFELSEDLRAYLAKNPLLYKDYFHSYLFDFLKMRIGTILGTFPPFPEELTKVIIKEMKKYSNEHGAHFVVLNWRWSENDYDRLFRDLDIDVIDTMNEAPDGWEEMVLFQGIHPDAEASKRATRLLLKYFRDKGLLEDGE